MISYWCKYNEKIISDFVKLQAQLNYALKRLDKRVNMIRLKDYICKDTAIIILALCLSGCASSSFKKADDSLFPGKYADFVLLPNGWKLTPAGNQINIGELPLNSIVTKNENYLITSNSGAGENSLSVVSLQEEKEVQRIKIDKTWRGLAFNKDESKLFVSGGNNNLIYIYDFKNGLLSLSDSLIAGKKYPKEKISITGVDFWDKKNYLLAVSKESNTLYVFNVESKQLVKELKMPGECFDIKINHAKTLAYVSIWGKASVAEINLNDISIANIIKTGDHPCEMLISKDDSRLYTANANNNSVSVIDLESKKEIEKLNSALTADAPYGSTPNAICLNKDELVLFIANADNNYLAVFDVSKKSESKSLGFIPVGWYPVSVKYLSSKDEIVVSNGKGTSSSPNPDGPNPLKKKSRKYEQYIGSLFKGAVSVIPMPDEKQLSVLSERVYLNTPYASNEKKTENTQSAISAVHNSKASDKIKYVFYIIKENRTYDQVYGDMVKGNGDSSLCIFGENITPNQHNIANTYALFDNYYADAEVSADGHNWSTAAYATDYVEKNWPVLYGGRGGSYDFEGGVPIATPSSGYIWDAALKKELRVRIYGEFVEKTKSAEKPYQARDEYMRKYTSSTYPGFDLAISDVVRYEKWNEEFSEFEKKDSLPHLSVMRLPNNHTAGTQAGSLTPLAFAAQNDYALGLIVERISKSKFWKECAIFVLEDDAQNGSDHVDAHRSCFLAISPYIKKNSVDHTLYSTSSVLKTIELILGLPPMTQFDLSAKPVLFPFSDNADLQEYHTIHPKIDIEEKNTADAYGAKRCSEFNLAVEDAIPDIEFNEIIWKSVKGKNSEMPAPVKSAFVKPSSKKIDDDD